MKTKIENISDLRVEIVRLELQRAQQEELLTYHAKSIAEKLYAPLNMFNKLASWFGDVPNVSSSSEKSNKEHDWLSNSIQVILPLIVDKLFLRKSNFIIKTLGSLISQNIGSLVNKNMLISGIDHISEWFKKVRASKEEKIARDFGIPPDSETY